MCMAKVLAVIAFVFAAFRARGPLGAIIGMSVMRQVKAHIVDGLGHAFHAHEEQDDHE